MNSSHNWKERGFWEPGRKRNLIAEAWALRFNVSAGCPTKLFTASLCWTLAQCRSDEARRLNLGVSR